MCFTKAIHRLSRDHQHHYSVGAIDSNTGFAACLWCSSAATSSASAVTISIGGYTSAAQVATGEKRGVEGSASGNSGANNYGGFFSGSNAGPGNNNYGVYSTAMGSGNNYALYANATGGTNNWAGYFGYGNVKVENDLEIDGKVKTPSSGNNNMIAYAYGTISETGSKLKGTDNFDINLHNNIDYHITLKNESGQTITFDEDNFIVVVTPVGGGRILANYNEVYRNGDYSLNIQMNEISQNSVTQVTNSFSFVVYKP